MKLSDLRKVAVKKHLRIRFSISNGMECVVNEHGIAQVPALRAVPSFNLENELAAVQAFTVEPGETAGKDTVKGNAKPKARRYTRDEMTAFATSGGGAEAAHEEHDD
jgi:hypothetical protein